MVNDKPQPPIVVSWWLDKDETEYEEDWIPVMDDDKVCAEDMWGEDIPEANLTYYLRFDLIEDAFAEADTLEEFKTEVRRKLQLADFSKNNINLGELHGK